MGRRPLRSTGSRERRDRRDRREEGPSTRGASARAGTGTCSPYAIGAGLLRAAIALVADAERTEALLQMLRVWTLVLAIDFLVSFSYTLWPRRSPAPC